MIQRSDEWYRARLGKVTASRVIDIMPGAKGEYKASRKNYMMELLTEILTGVPHQGFVSKPMERGIELEDEAREYYEFVTGNFVTQVGFIDCPYIERLGASPDGLIGIDGGIEIKCPNTATHVDYILTGKIDTGYTYQIQTGIYCTDRQWWDFVSYDDRLPDKHKIFIKRVDGNQEIINNIKNEVVKFNKELDEILKKLEEK